MPTTGAPQPPLAQPPQVGVQQELSQQSLQPLFRWNMPRMRSNRLGLQQSSQHDPHEVQAGAQVVQAGAQVVQAGAQLSQQLSQPLLRWNIPRSRSRRPGFSQQSTAQLSQQEPQPPLTT